MFNLNVHPIFVHFPIALLTIYSLLGLIRFNKIKQQPYWFYVKATFVIIGSLASYLAFFAGQIAEGLVSPGGPSHLIEVHSDFALATVIIFSVIAIAYIIAWLRKAGYNVWTFLVKLQSLIIETKLIILLAFIGLIVIFTTGALGGSIVYGPENDPITKIIYNLIIK